MIVLFGATGYTGARVAEAMARRGLRPVLAGRDRGKLTALARRLGDPEPLDVVRADAGDLAPVRALIGQGDVLVSTVGPFVRFGEAAVRAALDAGAIYLDSTGEPPFIRRVFEEFGPLAQRSGASLITAFGHDYVPGNIAGALALRRCSTRMHRGAKVHRVEVGYLISGRGRAQVTSRGTVRSAIGLLTEQGFTWRDRIQPESTASRTPTFTVAGLACVALAVGATEHYALPRLAGPEGLAEVDVYFGRLGPTTPLAQLFYRRIPALLAIPGARPLARRVGELALRWVAEEPDPTALARISSHVIGTAYDVSGAELAQVRLVSGDPYGLTANLLAWGAQRAAEHGVARSGAVGPAEAFGLDVLVAGAAEAGLRHWPGGCHP